MRSLLWLVLSLLVAGGALSHRAAQASPYEDSPFGFHPAGVSKPGYGNNGFNHATDIGVKWAREGIYALWFLIQPDLAKQEYDFSLHDGQWRNVPKGMNILANIAPQGPIDEGYALPGSYLPVDAAKYIAFVKATVERYDGDGINDMPGLQNPIKYWQVGNEPSVHRARDFAELQRITYTAIKEACPDCTVLIAGVAGMPPTAKYLADFNLHYKPILDALGGKYVDVMDFHWYGNATGDYRGASDAYRHIRSVLDADGFSPIPMWITEMGSYSGDPASAEWPLQTERQQALDYLKRFVHPLSFGVKKVFPAFGLMEGFKYDSGYFDFTGLIYDGWGGGDLGLGVKKLSYHTYKKLTEVLEGSDWNNIQTIQEAGDVYVYKFTRNGTPVYVAWWDYFNDPTYTPGKTMPVALSGVPGSAALLTEAVPSVSSGAEVTDYHTAFRQQSLPVSNGTVAFALGDSPVFVEGPALHLRVNGQPHAAVTATNPVTVDYAIRGGQGREFFLVLDAPAMGIPWAYRTAADTWVPLSANLGDVMPFATAPADGDRTLHSGNVPAGNYTLCLGYDGANDGRLNMESAVYDCATATVQ